MKTSLSVWEQKLVSYQQVIASAGPGEAALSDYPCQSASTQLMVFVLLRYESVAAQLCELLAYHPDIEQVQTVTDKPAILAEHLAAICFCDSGNASSLSTRFKGAGRQLVVIGRSNADALKAFEAGAAAFIQLPLQEQRVLYVISDLATRMQELIQQQRVTHLLDRMIKKLNIAPDEAAAWIASRMSSRTQQRVTFRSDNAWCSLACDDINWVQAAGDYMCIYTAGENYVVRTTLADLSRKLSSNTFQHVNRSELVNRHFVKMVEQCANRVAYLVLNDGTRLKISRRHFAAFWQHNQ
ncbi:LytTR family transcriptional regulator [Salinimonas sp. HHU 13199]|uniref:LytTR family transcriptional regulator n=1 Tax=Salinimonas profundi TaxID=2729140 RepID=A0ABR8LGT5_9ALTE|nr:LytTR family DNA-binding domain-containing protein [Salinimonas profundi]MBD3585466.1 LytTR family transcriptional regulator [Salinimonas profundi]